MLALVEGECCNEHRETTKSAFLLLVGLCLLSPGLVWGKPALDLDAISHWPQDAGGGRLSPDGRYALFTEPRSGDQQARSIVIMATRGESWKVTFDDASDGVFTDDSRSAVFLDSQDVLNLLALGTTAPEQIPGVASFKLVKHENSDWLVYSLKSPTDTLTIRDLSSGKTLTFNHANKYLFTPDGNAIVLLSASSEAQDEATQLLRWINLRDGETRTVWKGVGCSTLVLDRAGSQLSFLVEGPTRASDKAIWYYRVGAENGSMLLNNRTAGLEEGLELDDIAYYGFSRDGKRLFVNLKEKNRMEPQTSPQGVKVDVWSYRDAMLQSAQLAHLMHSEDQRYLAVTAVEDPKVIRLQRALEEVSLNTLQDDKLVVLRVYGEGTNEWWNAASGITHILESTVDGKREPLPREFVTENVGESNLQTVLLSPTGTFLVRLDSAHGDIWSYPLGSGVAHNLTRNLPVPRIDPLRDSDPSPWSHSRELLIEDWLDGDAGLLVRDRYDIWLLDPTGREPLVNVTNSYGRRQQIHFRVEHAGRRELRANQKLLLSAFNENNKEHILA